MEKFWGGIILGIFVGAIIAEGFRKLQPDCIQKVTQCTKEGFNSVNDAFMNGYREATASNTE